MSATQPEFADSHFMREKSAVDKSSPVQVAYSPIMHSERPAEYQEKRCASSARLSHVA